jgi:hypothetical protein
VHVVRHGGVHVNRHLALSGGFQKLWSHEAGSASVTKVRQSAVGAKGQRVIMPSKVFKVFQTRWM